MSLKAFASWWLVLVGAMGCSSTTFLGECKRDSDCRAYESCDTLDFRCICKSDEACALGEYCNPSGSCQRKSACNSNVDCATGSVCDISSGTCLPGLNHCTNDFQCAVGQICSGDSCQFGCRDTSDCDLNNREVCKNGSCQPHLCETNLYCDFGLVCDSNAQTCGPPIGPHCLAGCSPICETCQDKSQGPCGDPKNTCYQTTSANTFCLVACQKDEDCPSGYECISTTVDWADCNTDADCSTVTNICSTQSHRCALSRQPCDNNNDCVTLTISCELGSCKIGSHCRPPGGCD